MELRNLGGLRCSAVGFGCMGLSQAYGPADDDASVAAIRAAIGAGVTLLDTAMSYGAGHNERLVGRALRTHPAGASARVVTKGGMRWPGGSWLPDGRAATLRADAEASLAAGHCEDYYSQFMSPNFNRSTSKSARKTLVTACTNNESTRETMITTLRVVQELSPKYDLGGSRAIYDVSGQGLPYDRFVLERDKDMHWYIAE